MEMDCEPPLKVMPRIVEAWMSFAPAFPPPGCEIAALVMGRAEVPNVLEIWILIWSAPMDMCSVWRIVASLRTALDVFWN